MIEKCLITGLPTLSYYDGKDNVIQYGIKYNEKELYLTFSGYPEKWSDNVLDNDKKTTLEYIKESIENVKHILCGLIFNDKWPKENIILNKWEINKIIQEADYPKTPKEKLDNLFITLFNMQEYDGSIIDIAVYFYFDNNFWKKLYFKDGQEGYLYLATLIEMEYIIGSNTDAKGMYHNINFTYKGLEEAIKLTEEGKLSNNCFVAMSFDKEEDSIYFDAIKPACKKTGFEAKRVDYEHYDSEKTIIDAIIALLKQCKFCIADFTKQKENVYFESGYALGRGLKVIYTCKSDYIDDSAFNTNHFPHIVYKTNEEL
ncbi:MAG: hypothetical protein WC358_04195, partial [Ignavibacteria bacterium]